MCEDARHSANWLGLLGRSLKPYYDHNGITSYHGDCLEIMPDIEDGSVDLVFVDPPYNIKKAEWDKIENYQAWCELWVVECSRVLKPNGAFWVSHSEPLILADISKAIQSKGRSLINWITWDKLNGNPALQATGGPMIGNTMMKGLRSFQWMAEYLIYHTDEGEWISQCDKEQGFIFEPLRKYLSDERSRAGFTTRRVAEYFQKKTGSRTVTGMAGHWFEKVQWALPTEENYKWLRSLFNPTGFPKYLRREYGDLRREYEDLRREYKDLRYTFNNPGKMSSVWQIPPAKATGHPTPKPEELLKRIIEATSNEDDTILDPFAGSGTTLVAAKQLGRKAIGIEIERAYYKITIQRLAQGVLF